MEPCESIIQRRRSRWSTKVIVGASSQRDEDLLHHNNIIVVVGGGGRPGWNAIAGFADCRLQIIAAIRSSESDERWACSEDDVEVEVLAGNDNNLSRRTHIVLYVRSPTSTNMAKDLKFKFDR